MLGLGIDVDIDVKNVHIPFHFEQRNECVHCGGKGTLAFIDIFGRTTDKEVNAFDHIKCTNCSRVYSIEWAPNPDKDPKKIYPSAVDPSIRRDFKNLMKRADLKESGVREI